MKVNVLKTKSYYQSLSENMLCDCAYCQNYTMQVKSEYPRISAYLEALGIDIEKPFELMFFEPDDIGMLDYLGCQYVVFGNCDDDYFDKIGHVEFRKAPSHPSTGIADEHFILEFYPITLKYNEGG